MYASCVFFWKQVTDPPMYNVASAVFWRSLAIVRSLPLPGCANENIRNKRQIVKIKGVYMQIYPHLSCLLAYTTSLGTNLMLMHIMFA